MNIHLLHVHDNGVLGQNGTLILRLDHSFEVGEDPVYSQPVSLVLNELFTHIELDSCTEMSLTANQPVSQLGVIYAHSYIWAACRRAAPCVADGGSGGAPLAV